jgi:hypothetical protein
MNKQIIDRDFYIIPVLPPKSNLLYGIPYLSLTEILNYAANPVPARFVGRLTKQEVFSQDLRSYGGFSDNILETIYIKFPETPIVLHQCLDQFREAVLMAARLHYGSEMEDRVGEYAAINISQRNLSPGEVSTFFGRHLDGDYECIFNNSFAYHDDFIVSDCFPTVFVDGGWNLAPVLDHIRGKTTESQRISKIPSDIEEETYSQIFNQTRLFPTRTLAPYEMARYTRLDLHEAQRVLGNCRRTLVNINFYAPNNPTDRFSDVINNGRLADFLKNPMAVLDLPNVRFEK